MRVLIVTSMRNEAPFVLEWLSYHRHIGVTDFLIFSNDCDDGTDAMLDRLAELGIVHHVRSHSRGQKSVQWRALNKADRHPLLRQADWVMVTDVDEFLCIHPGQGHLTDLFAACADAEGFAIPWRMFGNGGQVPFVDEPITQQFIRAAPERMLWPWRAVQYKSLFRIDPRYAGLGVHRPRLKDGQGQGRWVDGNGQPLPHHPGTMIPTTAPRYGLVQINHYAVGAMENFLIKVARGRPNHMRDPIDLAYWCDRNFCDEEDRRILRHADAVADGVRALRADPAIDRLHDNAVRWRKRRIAVLLQQSEPFYLMSRLRQSPPTRPLPLPEQQRLFHALLALRQRQSDETE